MSGANVAGSVGSSSQSRAPKMELCRPSVCPVASASVQVRLDRPTNVCWTTIIVKSQEKKQSRVRESCQDKVSALARFHSAMRGPCDSAFSDRHHPYPPATLKTTILSKSVPLTTLSIPASARVPRFYSRTIDAARLIFAAQAAINIESGSCLAVPRPKSIF